MRLKLSLVFDGRTFLQAMVSKFFQQLAKSFSYRLHGLIILGIILIFGGLALGYVYNQFLTQDRISLEVLRGKVTKYSLNGNGFIQPRGEKMMVGDSLSLEPDTTLIMVFHDGSTMAFSDQENIKYNSFKVVDQYNYFSFTNQVKSSAFEYVTQNYVSKAGAVILGRETGIESLQKSEVLGATEKSLNDLEKKQIWTNLNTCLNYHKEISFSDALTKCKQEQNIDNIQIFEN